MSTFTPAYPARGPGIELACTCRGGHRHVFRYRRGEEPLVLEAMIAKARDLRDPFGWGDAFALCKFMGKGLAAELLEAVTTPATPPSAAPSH